MDNFKIITDEEQAENYKLFLKRLERVSSGKALLKLGSDVYSATSEKAGGNMYFMKKDDKTSFWQEYNKVKAEFAQGAIKELNQLLTESLEPHQCAQINSQIHDNGLISIDVKKTYWAKFKEKAAVAA